MKRKLLALALSASMTLSLLPATAVAAETPPDITRPGASGSYDNGNAVFDHDANTLTLTNANIGEFIGDTSTQVDCYGDSTAISIGPDSGTLTIVLHDGATLTVTAGNASALGVKGYSSNDYATQIDIIVKGEGTLNVSSYSSAVRANSLTVTDAVNMTVDGHMEGPGAYLHDKGSVTLGGNLNVDTSGSFVAKNDYQSSPAIETTGYGTITVGGIGDFTVSSNGTGLVVGNNKNCNLLTTGTIDIDEVSTGGTLSLLAANDNVTIGTVTGDNNRIITHSAQDVELVETDSEAIYRTDESLEGTFYLALKEGLGTKTFGGKEFSYAIDGWKFSVFDENGNTVNKSTPTSTGTYTIWYTCGSQVLSQDISVEEAKKMEEITITSPDTLRLGVATRIEVEGNDSGRYMQYSGYEDYATMSGATLTPTKLGKFTLKVAIAEDNSFALAETTQEITVVENTIEADWSGQLNVPVTAEEIDTDMDDTDNYTIDSVSWTPVTWDVDDYTKCFDGSTVYTATVTLDELYNMSSLATDSFTHSGATSVTCDPTAKTVTLVFPVTAAATIDRIWVSGSADETYYVYGDTFDPTGLTVTAYYNDGTQVVLGKDDYTMTDGANLQAGQTEVTFSYSGKTATYKGITVSKASQSVTGRLVGDAPVYGTSDSITVTLDGLETTATYKLTAQEDMYTIDATSGVITPKTMWGVNGYGAIYVWADVAEDGNHHSTSENFEVNIAPRPLEITLQDQTFERKDAGDLAWYLAYGSDHTAYTSSGLLEGDIIEHYSYSTDYPDDGSLTEGARLYIQDGDLAILDANENSVTKLYDITCVEAKLIITKRTYPHGNWPQYDLTYGSLLGDATVNSAYVGNVDENGTYVFDDPDATFDVGYHDVGITFNPTDTENYTPATGTTKVKVAPLDIATLSAVQVLSIPDQTYTGEALEPEVVIAGLTPETDYTVTYRNTTDAGDEAEITIDGQGNYQGSYILYFTILGADYTGDQDSADIDTKYGNSYASEDNLNQYGNWYYCSDEILDISDPDEIFEVAPVVGDDSGAKRLTYTIREDETLVGKTATITTTVTYPNYKPFEYVITVTVADKAMQTLALVGLDDVTYGDTDFAIDVQGKESTGAVTFASTDATMLSIQAGAGTSATGRALKAGEVTVSVSVAGDDNYKPASVSKVVNIKQLSADIAVKDATLLIGNDFPEYEYQVTGLLSTDALTTQPTIACDADGTTVGTFDLVASGADANGNYDFAYTTGTLTVLNKTAQTITLGEIADKTYGDESFTLSSSGTTGTGAVTYTSSDDSVIAIDGTTATVVGAGSATIQVDIAEDSTYAAASHSQEVTVNTVTLTITAEDKSAYRNEDEPEYTCTITGLLGDETLVTQPTVSGVEVDMTTNGTYVIRATGAVTSENYTVDYVDGTLTISTKPSSSLGGSLGGTTTKPETTTDTTETEDTTIETETTTTANKDGSTTTEKVETATDKTTGEIVTTTETATTKENDDGATITETVATAKNETTGEVTETTAIQTVTDTTSTKEEVKTTTTAQGAVVEETSTVIADSETKTQITATVAKENGETTQAALVATATEDTTDVTIPQEVLTTVATEAQATVTVQTAEIEIVLDEVATNTVATAVSEAPEEHVVIAAEKVDTDVVTKEQTADLENILVVDLTITVGGDKVSDFKGGSATVSIPYTKSNKTAPLAVYYVADDGTISTVKDFAFDSKTGLVTFKTSHFSYYMVSENTALTFNDVAVGSYCYEAVKWAVQEGVTTGTTDTTFSPDMTCTRAQAVTFLWNAAGKPQVESENPFTDVSQDAWYYDAVLWAVSEGITQGTSETTFSPDADCTRSQIVTFLWNAEQKPVVDYLMTLEDVAGDTWYTEAVRWAVSEGITSGTSATTFSPNADCTRGQIVTLLYRNMVD